MKRLSRLCSAGCLGLAAVVAANANDEIRQPPSIDPLPRVIHATQFDIQSFRLDTNFQFTDLNEESGVFFRFREPQRIFSNTEATEFQASPLRFIRGTDPPQSGNSFPSKYLKEEGGKDEPTPANIPLQEESPKQWMTPAESHTSETLQADENPGLVEMHAIPAEAVPPEVNNDTVVEGAGEPTSMPLDAASCTRSLN